MLNSILEYPILGYLINGDAMGFLRTLIWMIFKKPNLLDNKTIQNTALQVAMFQNWYLENGPRDLNWEEVEMVIKKILGRDSHNFNENDLLSIQTASYSLAYGVINQARKKTMFDKSINEFCTSIQLEEKFYKF